MGRPAPDNLLAVRNLFLIGDDVMSAMRVLWIVGAMSTIAASEHSFTKAQTGKQTEPKKETPAADAKPETTDKAVEFRRFTAHKDWVWTVALAPNGKTLVSGGGAKDHMVRSWDFATGKKLQEVDARGSAQSVVVFPDGRGSALASADKTMRVWDILSGKELRRLRGHTGQVFTLTLTGDGRTLASASEDGTVRLWDPAEGAIAHDRGLRKRGHGIGVFPGRPLAAHGRLRLAREIVRGIDRPIAEALQRPLTRSSVRRLYTRRQRGSSRRAKTSPFGSGIREQAASW